MDAGAGGVIRPHLEPETEVWVERGLDVRDKAHPLSKDYVPGAYLALAINNTMLDHALSAPLLPTEARRLAAALVALVDEIEGEQ
jgi:hypothetical protein